MYSPVDHLLRLARGEYPVRCHPSDYVSWEEHTPMYRQSLQVLPPTHTQPRLIVSLALSLPAQADSIIRLYSGMQYFNIEISGCDLGLLHVSHVPRLLSAIQNSSLSILKVYSYQLLNIVQKSEHLPLSSRTKLSLISDHDQSIQFGDHLHHLISRCDIERVLIIMEYTERYPHSLIDPLANISSFSLKGWHLQETEEADQTDGLPLFIERNKSHLDYFVIDACLTLMPQCLKVLSLCARLKVLSVTQRNFERRLRMDCSPATIFSTIGSLARLEYFEWAENIVLRTEDLVALHRTLCHCLPNLQHLHLHGFKVLLSTTDLGKAENEPIMELLLSLLTGKEGDERVSTYKFSFTSDNFKYFIATTRPNVCFYVRPEID